MSFCPSVFTFLCLTHPLYTLWITEVYHSHSFGVVKMFGIYPPRSVLAADLGCAAQMCGGDRVIEKERVRRETDGDRRCMRERGEPQSF